MSEVVTHKWTRRLGLFILLCIHCTAFAALPLPGYTIFYQKPASFYLEEAANAKTPKQEAFELQAVGCLMQNNQLDQAEYILNKIHPNHLTKQLTVERTLLQAHLSLLQNSNQRAVNILHTLGHAVDLPPPQKVAYYHLLAMADYQIGNFLLSAEARMALDPWLPTTPMQKHNREEIWETLNQLSTNELGSQTHQTRYGDLQGWLILTYIYKMFADEPDMLRNERRQWQQQYPRHPANLLLPSEHATARFHHFRKPITSINRGSAPLRIALLLPTTGKLATSANAVRSGFMSAYYQNQGELDSPAGVRVYDTNKDDVTTLYKKAISDGANVIVGPLTKPAVSKVVGMGSIPMPTLGLNFTNDGAKGIANLFEYALSPEDEAKQAAIQMTKDNIKNVLIIAPAGTWGHKIVDSFTRAFEASEGQVVDRYTYRKKSNLDIGIKKLLQIDDRAFSRSRHEDESVVVEKLPRREDFDGIFLVANPVVARQVKPLLKFYYAGGIPTYATSEVFSGKLNPKLDKDLDGIIFCDTPFSIGHDKDMTEAKLQMTKLAPDLSSNKIRLYAFGADAYQIATRLNPFRLSKYNLLDGLTGELYLDNHQIFRQLEWAQFKRGVPKQVAG